MPEIFDNIQQPLGISRRSLLCNQFLINYITLSRHYHAFSYFCVQENLRKHVLSTSKHPGKHLYECRFCEPRDVFKSNLARDFRAHLITKHPNHFGSVLLAASYVAGIYDATEDPKFVEKPIQLQPRWKR